MSGLGEVEQAREEELGLSSAALAALADFAADRGLDVDPDSASFRRDLQARCDIQDKDRTFTFTFEPPAVAPGSGSAEASGGGSSGAMAAAAAAAAGAGALDAVVEIEVQGLAPEMGQTLDSTGLTLWRAAEDLCRHLNAERGALAGKHVVELGAGLGLCSLFAGHFAASVLSTDGDAISIEQLRANVAHNQEEQAAIVQARGRDAGVATLENVSVAALDWGAGAAELPAVVSRVLARAPRGADVVLAADVCYEESAVALLFQTARALLAASAAGGASARGADDAPPVFLLAFCYRNVPITAVLATAKEAGLVLTKAPDAPGAIEGMYTFELARSGGGGGGGGGGDGGGGDGDGVLGSSLFTAATAE